MHLEDAELPLDEQDARLHRGRGAQREVDHPLDREPGATSTISEC